MAETAKMSRFEVIFDAEGVNASKFRNDVKVHLRGPYAVSYDLPTDEGGIHGGDGTAPYPLAYFTSALTACVMTQIRAFSRRLGIPVDGFSVNTRCHWQAQQTGNAPYESAPVAFTMDVDIGGDVSEADKRRLLTAAQKGCFVEQSLKPGLVKHRLKVGDQWVDAQQLPCRSGARRNKCQRRVFLPRRSLPFHAKRAFWLKQLYVVLTTPVNGMGPVLENIEAHLAFQKSLEEQGIMFAAGPQWTNDEKSWEADGMVVIRANSLAEARAIAEKDPMHASGARKFTVRPWFVNEGTVTIKLNYSQRRFEVQ